MRNARVYTQRSYRLYIPSGHSGRNDLALVYFIDGLYANRQLP